MMLGRLNFASHMGPFGLLVRAFIFVVPVIGAVEGEFCIVPFGMQFAFVPLVMVGVCVVVVPVPVGFVFVTGVPGVVGVVPGGFVELVVVVPLFVVVVVDVPLVVVVVFGVLLVVVFVDADVPGGQLVVVVAGVVVVVGGVVVVVVGVVGGFVVVVVGVVCANAGTAILTTSPATEARPSIARELMRLRSPDIGKERA